MNQNKYLYMFERTHIKVNSEAIARDLQHHTLQQDSWDSMHKQDINHCEGNFFYDAWQLKPEFDTPIMQNLMQQLGPVGQAKIIVVPPGTCYQAHADVEDRYHITLQADHSYLIDLESDEMYPTLRDDWCYLMNTQRLHTAANFGYQDRCQLVIRRLLTHHQLMDPHHIHIKPMQLDQPFNQRAWFDRHILVWLNGANKRGIMDNFNPMGEEVEIEFDLAGAHCEELQAQLALCPFDIDCKTDPIIA